MTWLLRHRVRRYVGGSTWVAPAVAAATALVVIRVLDRFEWTLGGDRGGDPDTARALLGTLAAAMFTFIVFVSSALLIAVQLASAQLTPRIIGLVFGDPVTRSALTLFVFTFTFTLAALVRIDTDVPAMTTQIAAYSSLVNLGVFLMMIDHVGRSLRPSGAVRKVGRLGRQVIESVYPTRMEKETPPREQAAPPTGEPTRVVVNPRDGVVLAFDLPGLATLAQRADCVLELVPQVGDFVAVGDPLFWVYQGGNNLSDRSLTNRVDIGQERTLEQDPAFAFRILVDIASKALSPAINDPTTAVLALDQIHHLLRTVGNRSPGGEQIFDAAGRLRLVYHTPSWADFVQLAVTEIRQFGSESIQVMRRLRAMLENLIQTLPESRLPLLVQELELIHRSTERSFAEPEDRTLAEVSDPQGVGAGRGVRRSVGP